MSLHKEHCINAFLVEVPQAQQPMVLGWELDDVDIFPSAE
jgi:hypothetical protein